MVLDVYSDFVNNFSVAMDLAKYCVKQKPAFAEFMRVGAFIQVIDQ
jgi:hypothetical protein